ncbi:MAG: hypothetical protein IPJ43_17445 [Saprospiraceae bacterium]|nr:hypothetical protein [Saprospiraceae bacterium]
MITSISWSGSVWNKQTIESQIHDLTIQLHDIMNHAIEIITTPESGEINYPFGDHLASKD